MKKYDVITALDTCVDLIISGKDVRPEFNQTEKLVDDYAVEMGGSSCIFACQAAKLGLRTAGVGVCGDDVFGALVRDGLSASGVDITHVATDPAAKTAVGVALAEGDDRAILTYLGTIAAEGLETRLAALLPMTRHIHFGSFFLMDGLRPHCRDIATTARKYGVTVSVDTNWDPSGDWDRGLRSLLPLTDIFFPNENEIRAITGIRDVDAAAASLRETGVVAVKQGGNGATVYRNGIKAAALPAWPVQPVDTVGAGDSFDAGFLYSYLRGWNMEDCLWTGLFCGSMSARARGGVASQTNIAELNEALSKRR